MEPVYLEVTTITTLVNKSRELIEDDEAAQKAMATVQDVMAERMAKAMDFSFMALFRPLYVVKYEPLNRHPYFWGGPWA